MSVKGERPQAETPRRPFINEPEIYPANRSVSPLESLLTPRTPDTERGRARGASDES